MKRKDEVGKLFLVVDWLPLVRRDPQNAGFIVYIYGLMKIIYFFIHGDSHPRIMPDYKSLLQIIPKSSVGDWFIFEGHTLIIIYGFEGEPYLLPTFTLRIFALEYIR